MAKTHRNAEKFPIQWDGDVTQFGGDKDNDTLGLYHQKWWEAFILKRKKMFHQKY